MHRIEGSNYVVSGGNNLFSDGPPGTTVTDDWLNAVQEELAYFIEQSGATLKTAATETRQQFYSSFLTLLALGSSTFKADTITQKTTDADIAIKPDGTKGMVIADDGKIYATDIHFAAHSGTALDGITNKFFASGTYTPVLSSTSNIAASTVNPAMFFRLGNIVVVFGIISLQVTAGNTQTDFVMTLPIAPNFTQVYQATGVTDFFVVADSHESGHFYAITSSNTVQFEMHCGADTAAQRKMTYLLGYLIVS